MELVDSPAITPGECICGRTDGPMVDTKLSSERGRIYVCGVCVGGMAELTGVFDDARRSRDAAIRAQTAAEEKLAVREAAYDELQAAVVLTLRQGAVTRAGTIQLRRRPA